MKKIAMITLSILFFSLLILRFADAQYIFKTMQEPDITYYHPVIIKAVVVNLTGLDKPDIPNTVEKRTIHHYANYPVSDSYVITPANSDLKPVAEISSVQCCQKLHDQEETVKLEDWMLSPEKWLATK
jgi:hypothetical protein